ncbi:MAG: TonB-dependent receptor [Candidatus Aminicenantes bacterium]
MAMKRLLLVGVLLLFTGSLALAQAPPSGRFQGKVTDDQGNPLPGVTVEAISPRLVGKSATVTDAEGTFRIFALPSGMYELNFTLPGFRTLNRTDVTLTLGQTIVINVILEPSAIEESITVIGQSPLIDVKSTVRGMTITKDTFQALPRGRNFDTLITTIPGVSNEPLLAGTSVDGASGLENMYYVDGADVTNIVSGRLAQSASFEFVDEVQVRASGYQAEFGGSLGGVISVISRSGGNSFDGEIVGYYSGSALRDRYRDILRTDLSSTAIATYYKYDFLYGVNNDKQFEFGGSLGGYLIRDRLWFFGSFLPVLYRNTRTVTHSTGVVAPWVRDERNWNYSGKLTAQIFNKLRLGASIVNNFWQYQGDLATRTSNPTPSVSYDSYGFSYPNYSAAATADLSLSNNLLFTVRGGYFMTDRTNQLIQPPDEPCFQFLTEAPGGYFQTTNVGLLDIPAAYQRPTGYQNFSRGNASIVKLQKNEKYSVSADLNYFVSLAGEHSWKLGGQWVRQGQNYDVSPKYPILFFAWDRDLIAYGTNYGRGTYGYYAARGNDVTGPFGDVYEAYSNRWAFYLQDSWTLSNRITVNAGLRTESEYIPSYATGNPDFENLRPIKFGFDKKLAPRLGIVFDVFGDSSLKVFGSLGWFYDVMKLEMASGSYGGTKWKSVYYKLDTYEWDKIGVNNFFPGDYLLPAPHTLDFRAPSFDTTDPDMKPMGIREISIGAEQKLRDDLALSVRLVNKHLMWAIEDIGILLPDGEHYYTTNPGGPFINAKYAEARAAGLIPAAAPDCPKAKREYYGVNIALDKRFSNNWLGGFSYTWSRLTGNYSGLASGDEYGRASPNVERYFDLWYLAFDSNMNPIDGLLPGDRPHYFKLYGSYVTPFGLTAGLVINAMSGVVTSTEWAMDVQGFLPFNRNDLGRAPFLWFANAYLAYEFKLGGKTRLQVNLNVDNLFNIDTAQRIYQIYNQGSVAVDEDVIAAGGWDINDYSPVLDPQFKKPTAFYGPLTARLGFKIAF